MGAEVVCYSVSAPDIIDQFAKLAEQRRGAKERKERKENKEWEKKRLKIQFRRKQWREVENNVAVVRQSRDGIDFDNHRDSLFRCLLILMWFTFRFLATFTAVIASLEHDSLLMKGGTQRDGSDLRRRRHGGKADGSPPP